jgi:hypothetical protein
VDESYVEGYFSSRDLLDTPYSNKRDMIYIDTYPGIPGSQDSNKTLAHEMQHLMNFVSSYMFRINGNTLREMDVWVNEGLSNSAEWVYNESHPSERWEWYNVDPSGLIRKGNNFFVWGSRNNEHHYARLDDYSTVYLFFQWLRLQAGNSGIYYDVITSTESNYRAITRAANNAMIGKGYDNWGTLLKTWLAANYINAPSGPYGYMNDATLKKIKAKTVPPGTLGVSLYPGEGVYSLSNAGFPWPGQDNNVKYAGLTNSPPWLNDEATYSGGALLTYNANTNNRALTESGKTTGVAASASALDRNQGIPLSGPFAIGMRDALIRNGHEENPDAVVVLEKTISCFE